MANLLDDLFGWAIEQPSENTISVQLALATNELTRDNLVSYAEVSLYYRPAYRAGVRWVAPRFASELNGITQYFSNRRYKTGFAGAPFSAEEGQSDPLDVTIAASGVFSGRYSIILHSAKWNFRFTFRPRFDDATNIIYGAVGSTSVTISFASGDRRPRRDSRPLLVRHPIRLPLYSPPPRLPLPALLASPAKAGVHRSAASGADRS